MLKTKLNIKQKTKQLFLVVMTIALLAVLTPVGIMFTTVYRYGDTTLSRQEIIERSENNVDLHCVETSSFLGIVANSFECFDTLEAAEAFATDKK
jgi:hypothetical protein